MDDFSELEAELRKLRPAPISPELRGRIERALTHPAETPTAGILSRAPHRSRRWWLLALGLTTVAALLVIGLSFFDQPPRRQPAVVEKGTRPSTTVASGLQPAALMQVVYNQRNEGLVFSPNDSGRPLRRMRYETRETMQWRNPRTGASLRVSYPAEQVVLTPVSFQ
jgi:anti-sigma-K factor RskA